MNNSVSNILNIKLGNIINDVILNDKNLDYDNIYEFLKKKKYFELNKKYLVKKVESNENSDSKLIKDKLLDYLENEPKFLIYNNSLEDVKNIMIKFSDEKQINRDLVTISFINDIIISYINSHI